MRRPHLRRRFVVAALALLALAPDAGAVLLTYGFQGTASVTNNYDPWNVLLGQVIGGQTEATGTFRVDSAAIDLDPSLSFALYHLPSAPEALVVNVGELTFRSEGNRIILYDDLSSSNGDLYDRLTIFSLGNIDPVVWPAYGYQLHTEIFGLYIRDSDEDDLALSESIAPIPPLGSFGPTNSYGQLGVSGCRLVGGASTCGLTHHFEISVEFYDVFLVPEPTTCGLLLFGIAALAAKRSGGPLSRSSRLQRNGDTNCAR
jgi:hypothetical protein